MNSAESNIHEILLYLRMLYHLENPCKDSGNGLDMGRSHVRLAQYILPTFKDEGIRKILSRDIENYAEKYDG